MEIEEEESRDVRESGFEAECVSLRGQETREAAKVLNDSGERLTRLGSYKWFLKGNRWIRDGNGLVNSLWTRKTAVQSRHQSNVLLRAECSFCTGHQFIL